MNDGMFVDVINGMIFVVYILGTNMVNGGVIKFMGFNVIKVNIG